MSRYCWHFLVFFAFMLGATLQQVFAIEFIVFLPTPTVLVASSQLSFPLASDCNTDRLAVLTLVNPEGHPTASLSRLIPAGQSTFTMDLSLGTYTPTPRAGHRIRAELYAADAGTVALAKDSLTLQFSANDAPGGPPALPPGFLWKPVPALSDEFDGDALDNNRWQAKHPYWAGRAPSRFLPENVSVANGLLQIRSTIKDSSMTGNWVWAGCVASLDSSAFPGMYIEAKIRSSDISMTSSFWLQGKKTEIDVTENFGFTANTSWDYTPQRSQMMSNTHSFSQGWANDVTTPADYELPAESDHRFFTFGVWWKDSTTIITYLDGQEANVMEPHELFSEKQFLFFDTETFSWQGYPTLAELADPDRNTMYVDWVRAWAPEAEGQASTLLNPGKSPAEIGKRPLAPLFQLNGRRVPSSP